MDPLGFLERQTELAAKLRRAAPRSVRRLRLEAALGELVREQLRLEAAPAPVLEAPAVLPSELGNRDPSPLERSLRPEPRLWWREEA